MCDVASDAGPGGIACGHRDRDGGFRILSVALAWVVACRPLRMTARAAYGHAFSSLCVCPNRHRLRWERHRKCKLCCTAPYRPIKTFCRARGREQSTSRDLVSASVSLARLAWSRRRRATVPAMARVRTSAIARLVVRTTPEVRPERDLALPEGPVHCAQTDRHLPDSSEGAEHAQACQHDFAEASAQNFRPHG